jgi:poly(3-hydroxybutyrate) depolymerase
MGVVQAKKGPQGELSTFNFADQERSYFIYTPEDLPDSPPLLVLLHGSGHDGDSLIGPWKKLADQEKIILVAPNSADPNVWSPYTENPVSLF